VNLARKQSNRPSKWERVIELIDLRLMGCFQMLRTKTIGEIALSDSVYWKKSCGPACRKLVWHSRAVKAGARAHVAVRPRRGWYTGWLAGYDYRNLTCLIAQELVFASLRPVVRKCVQRCPKDTLPLFAFNIRAPQTPSGRMEAAPQTAADFRLACLGYTSAPGLMAQSSRLPLNA
jgi:hypothetical protein